LELKKSKFPQELLVGMKRRGKRSLSGILRRRIECSRIWRKTESYQRKEEVLKSTIVMMMTRRRRRRVENHIHV
jgi:predicted CopG family antitoxin